MGLVGWGAGSFDTSYILSLTPSKQNNQLVDNQLMQQCVIEKWVATAGSPPAASSSAAAAAPAPPASPSRVTVTSVPIVMTTVDPVPTSIPFQKSVGDVTYTMTMSMVTETGAGEGEGEGLLTASGSPTLPAVATPTGKDVGGLETATGSPNGTAQATSPSGADGVVTASGAEGNVRMPMWATVLSMSIGMVFIL